MPLKSRKKKTEGKKTDPFLFLSMIPGMIEWAYVLVQMNNRSTSSRDWKLNMAVLNFLCEKRARGFVEWLESGSADSRRGIMGCVERMDYHGNDRPRSLTPVLPHSFLILLFKGSDGRA